MLVGNKSDLADTGRQVSIDQAKEYASESEMLFFETSALNASNVEVAFRTVFERVYDTVPKTVAQDSEVGAGPGQNTIRLKPPTTGEDAHSEKPQGGGGCC